MESAKKHDWSLVVMGVLLIACAFFVLIAPGVTLVTITIMAGAGFLVAGVFDIVGYVRLRKSMEVSWWMIAYAILDILVGLMLLIHPLALAVTIPWLVGAGFVLFGIVEIVAAVKMRQIAPAVWGWMLFSGIVSTLCGILFFVSPVSFSFFLAAFVLMRGFSLIFYGWSAGKNLVA